MGGCNQPRDSGEFSEIEPTTLAKQLLKPNGDGHLGIRQDRVYRLTRKVRESTLQGVLSLMLRGSFWWLSPLAFLRQTLGLQQTQAGNAPPHQCGM